MVRLPPRHITTAGVDTSASKSNNKEEGGVFDNVVLKVLAVS